MKLVKPSFEIWEQPKGLQGIYEQIERVGRVCYKSEDKIRYRWYSEDKSRWINEDSAEYELMKSDYPVRGESLTAKAFVDRMIASKHYAMLEHGTIYLKAPTEDYVDSEGEVRYYNPLELFKGNPYSKVVDDDNLLVTTNYRVLLENGWEKYLKYICEPTEFHEKRVTVHFVCDRGVSHEFVRHRVMSFAQESTRYCNYSKDKFGNEVTYILPCWLPNQDEIHYTSGERPDELEDLVAHFGETQGLFYYSLLMNEYRYFQLLQDGWKPQEARAVLPNALKTELVVTGFVSDWNHFCRLRTSIIAETGKPHPQAAELADPLMGEFYNRGYLLNKLAIS